MAIKHTAWEPTDFEQFKQLYDAGAPYQQIASLFLGVTQDQVFDYVGRACKDGTLVKRKGKPKAVDIDVPDQLPDKVLTVLKASSTSTAQVVDLANQFDVSPAKIVEAINQLKAAHYLVDIDMGHAKFAMPSYIVTQSERHAEYLDGSRVIKLAVATDAHLCSRYSRLDHLNTFFDLCQKEGYNTVIDAGNALDGEAPFNKNDLLVYGMDNQCNYWADNWPKRDGVKTLFICGDDHEGWWVQRQGIDIGRHMQDIARRKGRDDVEYLGYMEHDLVFTTPEGGKTVVRVQHPGGGSAYATSYTPQKIVESLSGGQKPNVLILGHYHKQGNFFVRNVHTVLGGCFCDQTPFMRKKRLAAHVGGYLLDITVAPDGSVLRFGATFIPFYADHQEPGNWAYKMLGVE